MIPEDETSNYELFRDILAAPLIEKCSAAIPPPKARQKRKNRRKSSVEEADDVLPLQKDGIDDAEELAEFIDYLASEIFTSLPPSLRTLNHRVYINTPSLRKSYPNPLNPNDCISILAGLSPSATDSLITYLIPPSTTLNLTPSEFLHPVLATLLDALTVAPLPPKQTKLLASGCEICLRGHMPLSYHHLIPRSTHAKVLVRKWHAKEDLESVAWLCRACHVFVRKLAPNEVLAKELFTVERLMEREECRLWAAWVGKVRWRKR